ncbi:MAG: hypothetical protein HN348_12465 [Proteobacteria bacterium]|nr:hypothetical protein [Pseudomonadota bacterium]
MKTSPVLVPLTGIAFLVVTAIIGCKTNEDDTDDTMEDQISSRSYQGHQNVTDSNNLVTAYPDTIGTRLDDCHTCHTGGEFTYDAGGNDIRTVSRNACDFCHLTQWPEDDYIEAQPTKYKETLNSFGLDYLDGGRDVAALTAMGSDDSDGDGHDNDSEIADLKYPGNDSSMPGQEVAPMVTYTMDELKALTQHTQFLLANSHKQQFDNYASYQGVKVADLLTNAGVDPTDSNIEGITIIAPDGYMKDFASEKITEKYTDGLYFEGLDVATLGAECGFVQYPDVLPSGLVGGSPIDGEQWLLFAWERDGLPMEASYLDITSGRINGEGPYRIIVPQTTPGSPDRGSMYATDCSDGWDYDASKDHNAGDMVRGAMAIRINPLPDGYEDFDHYNGGWAYVDSESVLIYGYGITAE